MFLNRLALQNYRNIEQFDLQLDSKVNLFVGPNAQGKTNILEAIYVLALTKSHRTNQDKELIRWNETQTIMHGEIDKKYGVNQLHLVISQQGKKAKINGLEQKKLSQFIGTLNVVLFAPEDLEIVKGSPGTRRRFLDMELGQVYPRYLHDIMQYQKILVQRNNYLKQLIQQKNINYEMLEVWNEQLVNFGVKIVKKRQSFIKKLQIWAERVHSGITNQRELMTIEYLPSFDLQGSEDETVIFEQFMVKLKHVKEQEIRRGVTLVGPHRDDMLFFINGKEVQQYGSQGQQRTTALSLKLAELELIHEEVGEYPILLLDDVLSELDQYRQTQLIETFQNKVQTFITTTSIESINLSKLSDAAIFKVRNGSIER
ncbi:DNA replication/repair protein RecF [Paenibacillus psychroresistens]|uniref:DNA replication and repair protein RecF n=1 Tax=Paenibacillus psychroresistens TaxID=1778678 RepID=A0A6B8R8M1_9BACL|nr:DNA replication/repair protein RecF [Paenibacillus psychroresistens]QGQ93431.1 DNA replication/repair protein RecF [Paenibacillus psychroresistens]